MKGPQVGGSAWHRGIRRRKRGFSRSGFACAARPLIVAQSPSPAASAATPAWGRRPL